MGSASTSTITGAFFVRGALGLPGTLLLDPAGRPGFLGGGSSSSGSSVGVVAVGSSTSSSGSIITGSVSIVTICYVTTLL